MKKPVNRDGLARVSYLPGFQPTDPETQPEKAAPDFATFFGGERPESSGRSASADSVPESSVPKSSVPESSASAVSKSGAQSDSADDASAHGDGSSRGDASTHEDALGRDRREVRAENVSMHALTRRGMSRWELEKTLLSRDLEQHVVDEELERLETVGLIDDAALAETFVRTQHERKGLGRSALTAELRRRHIAQEDIDVALEQVDDDDEQLRATELALKRAPQLHSFDLETAKRRLTGFLMRKGYASSIVRAAVDEALAERASSGGTRGSSGGVRFR